MSQQERLAAGKKWFRATHPKRTDGKIRVSRYYRPGKTGTWKHDRSTWAFKLPLKDLESAVSVTYCVCQSNDGRSFIYCLRVPHQYVLDHWDALDNSTDKSGTWARVFLAADSPSRFKEVRGPGGIDFGQFLI
jgi:hypothetical protein